MLASKYNQIPSNQSSTSVFQYNKFKPKIFMFPFYKEGKLKLSGQSVDLILEIRSLNFWFLDLFTGGKKNHLNNVSKAIQLGRSWEIALSIV